MTELVYGLTAGEAVTAPDSEGDLHADDEHAYSIFEDYACTVPHAGIKAYPGGESVTSLTPNSLGRIPFKAHDGWTFELYARQTNNVEAPVYLMYPQDLARRSGASSAAVTAAQADATAALNAAAAAQSTATAAGSAATAAGSAAAAAQATANAALAAATSTAQMDAHLNQSDPHSQYVLDSDIVGLLSRIGALEQAMLSVGPRIKKVLSGDFVLPAGTTALTPIVVGSTDLAQETKATEQWLVVYVLGMVGPPAYDVTCLVQRPTGAKVRGLWAGPGITNTDTEGVRVERFASSTSGATFGILTTGSAQPYTMAALIECGDYDGTIQPKIAQAVAGGTGPIIAAELNCWAIYSKIA